MKATITLADRLRTCYSGALFDLLRAKGYVQPTLLQHLRPLLLKHKLAGPIFTIQGKRDDSLHAHESLLKWWELVPKAPANTVLVCQPNDHSRAHLGELSSSTLVYKKVLGYIVDGGCRDSHLSRPWDFLFCKYFIPVDVVGKWAATALVRKAILQGVDPVAAYFQYGKL
jgi:4-hydroxy-4-methyl-2-oxoglutarate aldolase